MTIIKKEKIVHGIKIVKNRDFFLQDKNRFEREYGTTMVSIE